MSFPAFISGCTAAEEIVATDIILDLGCSTRSGVNDWRLMESVDIFTFDDKGIRALECYERIDMVRSIGEISIRTTTGTKKCVILANCHLSEEQIMQIGRYDDIKALHLDYRNEDDMHPSMGAEITFEAGVQTHAEAELEPFLSEIEIASLDAGDMEDICTYIVNAAESCPILPDDDEYHPAGFLNLSRLRENDLLQMKNGRILCHGLEHPSEGGVLYCYPNTVEEESAGSPFTRLALEGRMKDGTRLYSIDIGRPGKGVERGKRYSFEISIGGAAEPYMDVHPDNFILGKSGEDLHVWCEVSPPDTEVVISREDLDFDCSRGIYDYTLDEDGKGVNLHLKKGGTGMFCIDAGPPLNDGMLIVIVVDQDHIGI